MTTESVSGWAPPRPPRPRQTGRIAFWAVFGLVAVGLVSCVVGLVLTFKVYSIPSGSMENTLRPGGRIWVQQGQDVRRGDIVLYDIPPDSGVRIAPGTYVKRLIGLPGDHVACCDAAGNVTVNGKALHEQAYLYPGNEPSAFRFSLTLGPGQAWVMGDHRSISFDSRGYGPVPVADITGHAFEIKQGSSTVHVTTPAAFVADGLAPPDHRKPLPLILLGSAVILLVALLLLAVLGITRWTLRRRRARREALAFGQVT
ncbi:MAG TPA: signal peptidase I [Trebonia sp.]